MAWLLWLIGAILAAIAEMFSVDFIFLMFAGGMLGGMTAALAGWDVWAQVLAFSVVSTLLMFLARPAAKRWMETHTPEVRTNVARLHGRAAVVVAPVSEHGGRIKLDGEIWSARTLRPGEEFAVAAHVIVVEIDGAFAVVTAPENDQKPPVNPDQHAAGGEE